MSNFTQYLRTDCYDNTRDLVDALDEAANVIDILEQALVAAETDAKNWIDCKESLIEHGFEPSNTFIVLDTIQSALKRLDGR